MDSTPAINSKEFYRAQIRKKLDKQDAFLHRQAILTIEDMRRKGTYRGMTRDMTLEEKQVCLEIEMATLGIDPGYSSDSTLYENSPKQTNSSEKQKPRSCSPPIIRQSNPGTRKITDPPRPPNTSSSRLSRPSSPSVYSGGGVLLGAGRPTATTADVPTPSSVLPYWTEPVPTPRDVEPAMKEEEEEDTAPKNSCNRSCEGDARAHKRGSKSAKDLALSRISEASDTTCASLRTITRDKSRRSVTARPSTIPKRHMSISEEDFDRRCRLEGYLPRRWGYREF